MPEIKSSALANGSQKPVAVAADGRTGFFRGFFFWALSLFLLGMGVKLSMLHRCLNPFPYFDQWEGEAVAVYVPYYEKVLRFSDLFQPHNNHRIFFTRVYDLLLLLLNRQWDSQLQMVGNAFIHSATIAGFAWFMAMLMGRRYWLFIWMPLAVAVMSPFGWENALWGFQSQFYFLLLFSLLTICFLGCKPLSLPWRWGLFAGVCALFTMASGLLAFVAVGAVIVLEILKNRREWRFHSLTLGVCVVLAFVGLLLAGTNYDVQHNASARSLKEFFLSLGNNLSWPTGLRPWLAPLNLLPLLLLGWVYLRSPEKNQPAERIVLGIGIWIVLQCIATAIARGIGGQPPAWRYMDTLCFLFTANLLSIALLLLKYRGRLRLPFLWYAGFLLWLVPCATSLYALNARAWNDVIPVWARLQRTRVALTREFLVKNDDMVFANRDLRDLPDVYVPELVFLLRLKEIRSLLPACARDPLKVVPANASASAFVPGGVRLDKPDPPTEFCLGSYSTNGPAARGTFESAPMTSSLPYLQIQVAGDLGSPGLSLELVELASGKVSEVRPNREPRGQWLNVDVKAPQGRFKIVARDDSSTGWFAFKEPREMGRLSFWAEKIVGIGKYALAAGCLSFALALGAYCFPSGRNSKHLAPDNA